MESFYKSLYKAQSTLMLLFWKTWVFHWNVEGKDFPQLHELFNKQYDFMFNELDTLAEHIRTYNIKALGPLAVIQSTAAIEDVAITTDANTMLTTLLANQQAFFDAARELNEESNAANQPHTGNLAQQMMDDHGKMIWMLRSTLK